MGYEYRLRVVPEFADLIGLCDELCAQHGCVRIATSLQDVRGIGIRLADGSENWPHIVDLAPESADSIYVVCHNSRGEAFLAEVVAALRGSGVTVAVDADL